jgi:hypothetical protein
MQRIKLHKWLIAVLFATVLTSCARQNTPQRNPYPRDERRDDNVYYPGTEGMPPGQAKKVYGQQSAKVFAPGQRKKMNRPDGYRPPAVIYISDDLARTNRKGEVYYDNEYGYRYWKFCDGKYYLDSKYEMDDYSDNGNRGKKYKKGKNKKHREEDDEEDD